MFVAVSVWRPDKEGSSLSADAAHRNLQHHGETCTLRTRRRLSVRLAAQRRWFAWRGRSVVATNRRYPPDACPTCGSTSDSRVSSAVADCPWLACTWTGSCRARPQSPRPRNDHPRRGLLPAATARLAPDCWSAFASDNAARHNAPRRRDVATPPVRAQTRCWSAGESDESGWTQTESVAPSLAVSERPQQTPRRRLWPHSNCFAAAWPASHGNR